MAWRSVAYYAQLASRSLAWVAELNLRAADEADGVVGVKTFTAVGATTARRVRGRRGGRGEGGGKWATVSAAPQLLAVFSTVYTLCCRL